MAKRSREAGPSAVSVPLDKIQKSAERSHEQNQERAYVAASRRTDRSIEARIQSARMASAIHKKRTGRGFKLSEEIVQNEEMYEEDDDELSKRHPAISSQILSTKARQQEIDTLFAKQFPYAAHLSQQIAPSLWPFFSSSTHVDLLGRLAAKASRDKFRPYWHQWEPLHSQGASGDSSSLQHPSPQTTSYTRLDGEPSLPALTPPHESDSPSSSTPSSAPSPATDAILFPTNMTLLDERTAVFPVNFSTSDADIIDLSFHGDDIPPIDEVCYSIARPSAPLAEAVIPEPFDLQSPSARNLDIYSHTNSDNEVFNDQGRGWEAWLHADLLCAEEND